MKHGYPASSTLTISDGKKIVRLNDYLPSSLILHDSHEYTHKTIYLDKERTRSTRFLYFPKDDINTFKGRLSLLHEMGHAILENRANENEERTLRASAEITSEVMQSPEFNGISSKKDQLEYVQKQIAELLPARVKEIPTYEKQFPTAIANERKGIRSVVDRILKKIKISREYETLTDLDAKDAYLYAKFKELLDEDRKPRTDPNQIPGTFTYEDFLGWLSLTIAREREGWAQGLLLSRRIKKESDIDLLEGASLKEIQKTLSDDNALNSYQTEFKAFLSDLRNETSSLNSS